MGQRLAASDLTLHALDDHLMIQREVQRGAYDIEDTWRKTGLNSADCQIRVRESDASQRDRVLRCALLSHQSGNNIFSATIQQLEPLPALPCPHL